MSKEVIRLIGELKTDEAFLWLSRISAENLHKDEHVAVTRALWSYTDRDEAWDLLDGAIESGQPDRIDTALRVPPSGLSSKGRERLLKLCARALSVENVRTRLACITRMTLLPVMDVEGIVQPPLVRCINSTSPDEASAASRCLLKMYANHSGDLMSTVIRELANNTRSLVIFLSMVEGWMRQDRKFLVSAAEEIAEALSEQPRMISWQIRITAAASSWEKLGALLRSLDASNRLHADAMAAAAQAFTNISFRPDIEELESLEAELARQHSEQLRRLGLAALSALGLTSSGWTRSRLERLLEYRADDSMLVASAAALTLPANELQPAVAS